MRSQARQWQPTEAFPQPDGSLDDSPPAPVAPPPRPISELTDQSDPAWSYILLAALRLQLDFGFDLDDPDIAQRAVAAGRRRHREAQQPDQRVQRIAAARAIGTEVVYYMRIGNRVKIGFSAHLDARLHTINPEELMVVEPGGYDVEATRHRQFDQLRTHGEWFRLQPPLTEHIETLREQAMRDLTSR